MASSNQRWDPQLVDGLPFSSLTVLVLHRSTSRNLPNLLNLDGPNKSTDPVVCSSIESLRAVRVIGYLMIF